MSEETEKSPVSHLTRRPSIQVFADFLNLDLDGVNWQGVRERCQHYLLPLTDVEWLLISGHRARPGDCRWLQTLKKIQEEIRRDVLSVLEPAPLIDLVVGELKARARKRVPLGFGLRWNAWLFAEMKGWNRPLGPQKALQVPTGDVIVPRKQLKNVDWVRLAKAWLTTTYLDDPPSDKAFHLQKLVEKINQMGIGFHRSLQRWKTEEETLKNMIAVRRNGRKARAAGVRPFRDEEEVKDTMAIMKRYVTVDSQISSANPLEIDGEKWAVVERESTFFGQRKYLYHILDVMLRDGSFSRLKTCRRCQQFFGADRRGQLSCSKACNTRYQNLRRQGEGKFQAYRKNKRPPGSRRRKRATRNNRQDQVWLEIQRLARDPRVHSNPDPRLAKVVKAFGGWNAFKPLLKKNWWEICAVDRKRILALY